MEKRAYKQQVNELVKAVNAFGLSIEETTRVIEVLGKVNEKITGKLKVHPFAKYFKTKTK